ncbi:MAG: hypothetical protein MHM6MM_007364, partial [Cercozoa sp. M6MM]
MEAAWRRKRLLRRLGKLSSTLSVREDSSLRQACVRRSALSGIAEAVTKVEDTHQRYALLRRVARRLTDLVCTPLVSPTVQLHPVLDRVSFAPAKRPALVPLSEVSDAAVAILRVFVHEVQTGTESAALPLLSLALKTLLLLPVALVRQRFVQTPLTLSDPAKQVDPYLQGLLRPKYDACEYAMQAMTTALSEAFAALHTVAADTRVHGVTQDGETVCMTVRELRAVLLDVLR